MEEKRYVTLEEFTKARDDYYKDLDDLKDRLRKEADMDEYYDVPSETQKTKEFVFIIWGILSIGYMSYELFNMIKNKL